MKRGKKTWRKAFDQCPQLVFDGGKYAQSVCVSFLLWSSHFFLQMEEVRQDVAAPETQHTCNAARCYAMQASQTCLWPNKQQRKITTTTKKNNNNNFKNNNNNITDTKWYWKLQSNRIFILTLYCIKLLCPFHFAKYRQLVFDLCLRLKLNLCKIQTFDLSLCCSVSAIIDYLCFLFVSIAFCFASLSDVQALWYGEVQCSRMYFRMYWFVLQSTEFGSVKNTRTVQCCTIKWWGF